MSALLSRLGGIAGVAAGERTGSRLVEGAAGALVTSPLSESEASRASISAWERISANSVPLHRSAPRRRLRQDALRFRFSGKGEMHEHARRDDSRPGRAALGTRRQTLLRGVRETVKERGRAGAA